MSLTVAIVGRPNVGKSTLFNRLAGRRVALVDDTPGVTRDRREGVARLGGLTFTIIDTAGLGGTPPGSLARRLGRIPAREPRGPHAGPDRDRGRGCRCGVLSHRCPRRHHAGRPRVRELT